MPECMEVQMGEGFDWEMNDESWPGKNIHPIVTKIEILEIHFFITYFLCVCKIWYGIKVIVWSNLCHLLKLKI